MSERIKSIEDKIEALLDSKTSTDTYEIEKALVDDLLDHYTPENLPLLNYYIKIWKCVKED